MCSGKRTAVVADSGNLSVNLTSLIFKILVDLLDSSTFWHDFYSTATHVAPISNLYARSLFVYVSMIGTRTSQWNMITLWIWECDCVAKKLQWTLRLITNGRHERLTLPRRGHEQSAPTDATVGSLTPIFCCKASVIDLLLNSRRWHC